VLSPVKSQIRLIAAVIGVSFAANLPRGFQWLQKANGRRLVSDR